MVVLGRRHSRKGALVGTGVPRILFVVVVIVVVVVLVVVDVAVAYSGVDGVGGGVTPLLGGRVDDIALSGLMMVVLLRRLLQSGRGNGSEEGEEEDVAHSEAASTIHAMGAGGSSGRHVAIDDVLMGFPYSQRVVLMSKPRGPVMGMELASLRMILVLDGLGSQGSSSIEQPQRGEPGALLRIGSGNTQARIRISLQPGSFFPTLHATSSSAAGFT